MRSCKDLLMSKGIRTKEEEGNTMIDHMLSHGIDEPNLFGRSHLNQRGSIDRRINQVPSTKWPHS